MQELHGAEFKIILHSQRANPYCLEHCRVPVNGGRVEYVTDAGKKSLYWNIPIANTNPNARRHAPALEGASSAPPARTASLRWAGTQARCIGMGCTARTACCSASSSSATRRS